MKQSSSYTLKDIAKELGMSVSTVSRALSDHAHTSEETKKKVKEAVEKLGYHYNAMAGGLRNNKSNIIGLMVPRISMYFQSTIMTAIQNKLHEYGYNLMVCQSNDSPVIEKELAVALYSARIEGLIVASTLYTEDFSHFDIYKKNNIPLVFYDRVPTNYPSHQIKGDEFQGAYISTKHLLEQGCRRIALIGGPLSCGLYRERYAGYQEALRQYGLPLDEDIIFFHELNSKNAIYACEALFSQEPYPDGVFCCNDTTAIAVMQYAKEMNVQVPGQLKVAGYTNDPRTVIIEPPLTSVEQFPYGVGEQVANLMMDLIRKREKASFSYISITTPVQLITRASTQDK